jgi:hypothetical protein
MTEKNASNHKNKKHQGNQKESVSLSSADRALVSCIHILVQRGREVRAQKQLERKVHQNDGF